MASFKISKTDEFIFVQGVPKKLHFRMPLEPSPSPSPRVMSMVKFSPIAKGAQDPGLRISKV